MSRKYSLSFGTTNLGRITKSESLTWREFCEQHLGEFQESPVTLAEYALLPREDKLDIKVGNGWYVGGKFNLRDSKKNRDSRWRSKAMLHSRSMIALDIDHMAEYGYDVDDVTLPLLTMGVSHVVYSTPSSTHEDIRLRVVVPLSADIRPTRYQPIARWLADQIGIDIFDHTGYEEARLMFKPVCLADGPRVLETYHGKPLDAKMVLDSYEDFEDFGEWPSSEKEGGAYVPDATAEDPTQKQGVIGAFCRTFDIHDAIANWLTDEFEQVDDHTYRPHGSTGAAGARVYDDALFLYNNHESGITSKKNLNAFDLVRLCKFGDFDEDAPPETPINKLPSQQRMSDFAISQAAVSAEMSVQEFAELPDDADPSQADPRDVSMFEQISGDIKRLPDGESSRQETAQMLMRIAAARFIASDQRVLLNRLRTKFPESVPVSTLESDVRQLAKETQFVATEEDEATDLELELLREFEDEHFPNKTLKRIGKKYWGYRGGVWRMLDDEIVAGMFTETVIRLRQENPETARELAILVGETKTSALTGSLHRMMANLIARRDDRPDPLGLLVQHRLPAINAANCEIHFNFKGKAKRVKHSPENLFTTQIATPYEPESECPLYDEYMEHCFANAEDPRGMIRAVEEIGGYIMQRSRWIKMWVLLYGQTDTGKSTFLEVLTSLLGDAVAERSLDKITNTNNAFAEEGLVGKLLLADDDMARGALMPDGYIKKLSEAKVIQTPVKFANDMRFNATCMPLICSNHWPRTNDLSTAFVNRTVVVPFLNPYTGEDRSDETKARMIDTERSGILNRFAKGLARLRKRGYLHQPVDMQKARDEWMRNSNPVAGFHHDCMRKTDKARDFVRTVEIYDAYMQWHYDNYGGTGVKPIPKQELYRRMDGMLGARLRRSVGEVYKGWQVVEADDASPDEFDDIGDFEIPLEEMDLEDLI